MDQPAALRSSQESQNQSPSGVAASPRQNVCAVAVHRPSMPSQSRRSSADASVPQ